MGGKPTRPFSPLPSQAIDSLSAEQATEVYQLTAECQALGSNLQTLSRLEAMHRAAAQATAYETINAGCMVCSTTFGIASMTQPDEELESSLHRLHTEANKAWKDANDIIFSHLLQYDSQLMVFISMAEDALQAKRDEIWRHITSLTDTANITPYSGLTLVLQTLDQLPSIPWDLSYCASIPLMFAHDLSPMTSRLGVALEMGITF